MPVAESLAFTPTLSQKDKGQNWQSRQRENALKIGAPPHAGI